MAGAHRYRWWLRRQARVGSVTRVVRFQESNAPMPHTRRAVFALTFVLAMLAVVPPGTVAAAGRFTDDNGSRYEKAIEAVAAAGVMPGCTTHHFCPKTVVTKGKMAVYLARALRLKATVKTRFRDVPELTGERGAEGRRGRDHGGLHHDALLPEHGDHPGTDGRAPGQGAAPDGHRQRPLQGRPEAPQVLDRHRPTGDRRAGGHLREGRFCPDRKITRAETAGVPRQGHGPHHRHHAAPGAGQPGWQRPDPAGSAARGHHASRPRRRDRHPGELHRRGGRGGRRQGRDHHVRLRPEPGRRSR